AADTARARALFFEAVRLIELEQWSAAESALRRSEELVPRASTLYNLSLVAYKQGRLLESLEIVKSLLEGAMEGDDARYLRYARILVERVDKELPRVELTGAPTEAIVLVDGHAVSGSGTSRTLRIDPGSH